MRGTACFGFGAALVGLGCWSADEGARGAAPAATVSATSAVVSGSTEACGVFWIAPAADGFRVSPRWSPDGRWLLVAGRGGVGLRLLDPDGRGDRLLHAAAGAPFGWLPDGRVFGTLPGVEPLRVAIDPARAVAEPAVASAGSSVPASAGSPPGTAAEVLREAGFLRVLFEPYRGRLTVRFGDGERVLSEGGAWGARVSPDGARVVWCEGPLAAAELFVGEFADGAVRPLGRGVQPAWMPDGRRIVFSRPVPAAGAPGIVAAALRTVDLRDGGAVALLDLPGMIAMEPDVAPGGDRVAFADWTTGRIGVLRPCPAPVGGAP
jgi:Tol biopolymer transport system component